jgi:hypothetical protein
MPPSGPRIQTTAAIAEHTDIDENMDGSINLAKSARV